jgi:hypothetical protein
MIRYVVAGVVISSLSHVVRLSRAGFVFAREGVLALVDPKPLPLPARAALRVARLIERPTQAGGAVRLAAALTALGPTYVKLGQFLATRQDVVGADIARDLESLQDKMAPLQAQGGRHAVAFEPLACVYASFGPPSLPPRRPGAGRRARRRRHGKTWRSRSCGRASSAASSLISTPSSLPPARRKAFRWKRSGCG